MSPVGSRLRQISGNLSENSSSSMKEIRYWRGDEERQTSKRSDDRFVFVSAGNMVPFAVSSVISFGKSGPKSSTHRYSGERSLSKILGTICSTFKFALLTNYSLLLQKTITVKTQLQVRRFVHESTPAQRYVDGEREFRAKSAILAQWFILCTFSTDFAFPLYLVLSAWPKSNIGGLTCVAWR